MRKIFNLKILFVLLLISNVLVILCYSVGSFNAYLYPMKYKDEIVILSEKYGVKGALIASIANVESNFNQDAVSNKGAVGIMQLLPSTAQWIAGKSKIEYDENKLKFVEYNLELGTSYLRFLLETFPDEKVAICAYNAGQGNVWAWLANKEYSADGKSLQTIPFPETRNYLAKVLNSYNYYKNKYK